ncbi:MAG: hypothetical protein V3T26_06010 [candidate division NC10 bacterium]
MADESCLEELADVLVEKHGTLFLFRPATESGREWLEEHTDGTWFGGALVVEGCYARDLAQGLLDDGLEVE